MKKQQPIVHVETDKDGEPSGKEAKVCLAGQKYWVIVGLHEFETNLSVNCLAQIFVVQPKTWVERLSDWWQKKCGVNVEWVEID